jgi:hypothetical protein
MSVLLFGPEALEAQIAKVAPDVPEGDTWAVMGGTDETGVQAMILIKRDTPIGRFTAAGVLRHDWTGDNQAGVRLMISGR